MEQENRRDTAGAAARLRVFGPFGPTFARCSALSFLGLGLSDFWLRLCLRAALGSHGSPIFAPYRAIPYWDSHPLQYIGVACFCYALLSALWATFLGHARSRARALQICGVLVASVFVSSVLCGALWSFHDMQAGFFPEYPRNIEHLKWGAQTGLQFGPLIVLFSFPLNLIAFAFGYILTNRVQHRA